MPATLRVVLALVVLLWTRSGRAQVPPAEPIRIRFEGPVACSDESKFFDDIRVRTERVREAQRGETAREFRLSVRKNGTKYEGTIVLAEQSRVTRPRVVAASSCEEVVTTMALIAALSVSPTVESDPAPRAPAPPATNEPPSPPGRPEKGDAGMKEGPDDRLVRALTFDDPADAERLDNRTMGLAKRLSDAGDPTRVIARLLVDRFAQEQPRPARYRLAVGGGVSLLNVDGFVAAPRLFVDLFRDTHAAFAPSVRVGVEWERGGVTVAPGVSARPSWYVADVAFCPFRAVQVALTGCADVQVGELAVTAAGRGAKNGLGAWLAPGLSSRLETPPIRLAPWADFFLELDLGVRVPLIRDNFDFPIPIPEDVYKAPALIGHGEVQAGVRFW